MLSILFLATSTPLLAEKTIKTPNIHKILKEAENGNIEMQYSIGQMYLEGRYVRQDDKQALIWFEAAAKKGFPLAQYNLGWMYRNELGIQPASTQQAMAFHWLTIAAKNGVAKSQYQIPFKH